MVFSAEVEEKIDAIGLAFGTRHITDAAAQSRLLDLGLDSSYVAELLTTWDYARNNP